MKPDIRKILIDFVKNVQTTKPCIFRGDLDCLEKNLRNTALVGLKKAETLSTGRQRKLFAKLLTEDKAALKQLKKLSNGDIIRAAIVCCDMFNHKTNEINEYLAK